MGDVVFWGVVVAIGLAFVRWLVVRRSALRGCVGELQHDEEARRRAMAEIDEANRRKLSGQRHVHTPSSRSSKSVDGRPRRAPSSQSPERSTEDREDDGYSEFVERCWATPGVDVPAIKMARTTYDGPRVVTIHRVIMRSGAIYVNCTEQSVRKTLAGDDRHRWLRHGRPIDASAFSAILAGVDPDLALRELQRPATIAEALSPDNTHGTPRGRRFVIGYINGAGEASYRQISGVRRTTSGITALCHFRWGTVREFRRDRITAVYDAESGEELTFEDLGDPRNPPPKGKT